MSDVLPTTTFVQLRLCAQCSYSAPHSDWIFNEDEEYGPFFRVDDVEGNLRCRPEEWLWAGLAEPRTKEESIEWYKLDPEKNPMTHVHEFTVKVPKGVTQAGGVIGKVKNGTGIQINLNYLAARHAYKVGKPRPLV